jgi:hypothetical protein
MSNKSAAFLPIGIGMGVGMGTALGVATDNLALGLSLGVAIGSGLGVALMGASNLKAQKDKKAGDGSRQSDGGGCGGGD